MNKCRSKSCKQIALHYHGYKNIFMCEVCIHCLNKKTRKQCPERNCVNCDKIYFLVYHFHLSDIKCEDRYCYYCFDCRPKRPKVILNDL